MDSRLRGNDETASRNPPDWSFLRRRESRKRTTPNYVPPNRSVLPPIEAFGEIGGNLNIQSNASLDTPEQLKGEGYVITTKPKEDQSTLKI